jgi:hypothetical protein
MPSLRTSHLRILVKVIVVHLRFLRIFFLTDDPPLDGDYACVQGAEATCVNNVWQSTPCPQGGNVALACFAIPSVRHPGTVRFLLFAEKVVSDLKFLP